MSIVFQPVPVCGQNLNEEGQAVRIKFALTTYARKKKLIVNTMPFVQCRDYFSDIIYTQTYELDHFEKYGLTVSYDSALEERRKRNKYLFMAIVGKEDFINTLKNNLWVLHQLEDEMLLNNTKFIFKSATLDLKEANSKMRDRVFDRDTKIIHIAFDKRWFNNSVLFNFYTLMLRVIATPAYNLEGVTTIEILNGIVEMSKNTLQNEDTYHNYESIHRYFSDISLIKSLIKKPKALKAFIYRWRDFVGDYGQTINVQEECNRESLVHTHSCVVSLFRNIGRQHKEKPIQVWAERLEKVETPNV